MRFEAKIWNIGQLCLRIGLPLAVVATCAVVLVPQITPGMVAGFPAQLANTHWTAWGMAVLFTLTSLWAVGRYDGVAHQHFATRVPPHQARMSGTISITLAQTLGFGLFTGALARWRMMPDISLKMSFKISAFVSVSFMLCWAVVTAIACLVFQAPSWTTYPSIAILISVPIALTVMFRWPTLSFNGLLLRSPNLQCSAAILFWTAIDTTAVAGALFVLLPQGAETSFTLFLPLFLIALGTALLSNTPGGVGPFELMMLGLLPQIPTSEVLCSILAFRIIYYAAPAIGALVALIKPFRAPQLTTQQPVHSIHNADQAEVQVISQNGGRVLPTTDGSCAIWPTPQVLVALFNPLSGSMKATLDALTSESAVLGKSAFVYKCSGRNAAVLRKHQWSIIHNSDDAILSPKSFDISSPLLRRLRRKLRTAEKNGIIIRTDGPFPWFDLQKVDHEWQTKHGKARGGTMGRFDPHYLSTHFIARAENSGQLCGFVSFQRGRKEWCLDVMRHTDDMPDGTMHALVFAAINAARQAGISRLSLAATPACPDPNSRFFRWAARQAVSQAGGPGLRQFKSTFAPKWEPRYAAAPSPLALIIGLAGITREIHHPDPQPSIEHQKIHNSDENYELAS